MATTPKSGVIHLGYEQKEDSPSDNDGIEIFAPKWVEAALQELAPKLAGAIFAIHNGAGKDGADSSKKLIVSDPPTLQQLVAIARNEAVNTTGIVQYDQYSGFDRSTVIALRDLVKHLVIVGKTEATQYGGYYSDITALTQDVYICDLPGLQFQDIVHSSNTGRHVLLSADDSLPKGDLDDVIFRNTVGETKAKYADASKDLTRYIPGKYNGKIVLFDTKAYQAFIAQDFVLAATSLNAQAKENGDELNFRFLKYGAGFFADNLDGQAKEDIALQLTLGVKRGLEQLLKLDPAQRSKIKRLELPFYNDPTSARIKDALNEIERLCSNNNNIGFSYNNRDALKPTESSEESKLKIATTNCSDPHAPTGNEGTVIGYASVDAAIALNLKNKGNDFHPCLNTKMKSTYVEVAHLESTDKTTPEPSVVSASTEMLAFPTPTHGTPPVPSSDHNLIYKDGVIIWNMLAPGTKNGCQSEDEEVTARDIAAKNTPPEVAEIIQARLTANIVHLVNCIIDKKIGAGNIDAICLQEVPFDNQLEKVYFFETLNKKLKENEATKGFANDAYVTSIMQTAKDSITNESFGQITLYDSSKFTCSAPKHVAVSYPNQAGRVVEVTLTPTSQNATSAARTIWNIHGKTQPKFGHEPEIEAILYAAVAAGATVAGDTNLKSINQVARGISGIEASASGLANAGIHNSRNLIHTGNGYVDAIFTPKTAPHIVAQKAKAPAAAEIPVAAETALGKHLTKLTPTKPPLTVAMIKIIVFLKSKGLAITDPPTIDALIKLAPPASMSSNEKIETQKSINKLIGQIADFNDRWPKRILAAKKALATSGDAKAEICAKVVAKQREKPFDLATLKGEKLTINLPGKVDGGELAVQLQKNSAIHPIVVIAGNAANRGGSALRASNDGAGDVQEERVMDNFAVFAVGGEKLGDRVENGEVKYNETAKKALENRQAIKVNNVPGAADRTFCDAVIVVAPNLDEGRKDKKKNAYGSFVSKDGKDEFKFTDPGKALYIEQIYSMYMNLASALNTNDKNPIVLTLPGSGVFSAGSDDAKLIQGVCLRMAIEQHPNLKTKVTDGLVHLPFEDYRVMQGFNLQALGDKEKDNVNKKINDIFAIVNAPVAVEKKEAQAKNDDEVKKLADAKEQDAKKQAGLGLAGNKLVVNQCFNAISNPFATTTHNSNTHHITTAKLVGDNTVEYTNRSTNTKVGTVTREDDKISTSFETCANKEEVIEVIDELLKANSTLPMGKLTPVITKPNGDFTPRDKELLANYIESLLKSADTPCVILKNFILEDLKTLSTVLPEEYRSLDITKEPFFDKKTDELNLKELRKAKPANADTGAKHQKGVTLLFQQKQDQLLSAEEYDVSASPYTPKKPSDP